MRVRNATRDRPLGDLVRRAHSFAARARGLLGRRALDEGEGLWISPCRAIHSFGIFFPFDALFLDAGMRILAVYPAFPPNRLSRFHRFAAGALELPAGTIARTGTRVGDRVEFLD